MIGVTLIHDYDFPIDVTIQLDNVGGPSAGMMFALGIIDTLTPGELNGGENVAGTGTIDADGTSARSAASGRSSTGRATPGADYFLAPESELRRGRGPRARRPEGVLDRHAGGVADGARGHRRAAAISTLCPPARARQADGIRSAYPQIGPPRMDR